MGLEVLVTWDLVQDKLLVAMQPFTVMWKPSPSPVSFTVCVLLLKKERIAKPLRKGEWGWEAGAWVQFPGTLNHMQMSGWGGSSRHSAISTAVTLSKLTSGKPKATVELPFTAGRGIATHLTHFSGHPISLWSKDQINSDFCAVTTISSE